MPAVIIYTFVDNNGKEGRAQVYVSESLPLDSVTSAVQTVGVALSALSDAALVGAEFRYSVQFSNVIPAQPQANIYERLFLFFRNETYAASLSIPSPRNLPFNVDGPYRDIVIERTQLLLLGVQALNDALSEYAVIPDLRQWPNGIVAGVINKNQL